MAKAHLNKQLDNGGTGHLERKNMQDVKELARTVWQMRELQKSYFRNRTPASLGNAKAYEHKVDVLLRDILFPPMGQLFPIGETPWSATATEK